jgi:hypothetical protein
LAAHEKTHSKKLGEAGAKQKRKSNKDKNDDKPKRVYRKRKNAGEKTKRIKKEGKEVLRKSKKQKIMKSSFTNFDISSLTPDMINKMNEYLHQEFKLQQDRKKANNESIADDQQNNFSDFIKNFNYTFTKMNLNKGPK